MSLHASATGVLAGWSAPSASQDGLRATYVDHLAQHPDGCTKACFPAHLTAGALVVSEDAEHVLLNLHRKAGRWFAFGGHLEPEDPTLAAAARRECVEESGIGDLVVDPVPVHLSRHSVDFCQLDPAQPRGTVWHLDVRHVAVVPASTRPVISDESLEVRWFRWDEMPTDEQDMIDLVDLSRTRVLAR